MGFLNRDRFEIASLLYEYYIQSSQEQLAPAVEAGYAIESLDERDADEVVRITGAGTATTPIELKFDLGEVRLIDALAVIKTNIDTPGGCAVELGLTDGDLGSWDHTLPMLYNFYNTLANGGCERYNALTNTFPAASVVELESWLIYTGTPAVGAFTFDNTFLPPEDNEEAVSRVYGGLQNNSGTHDIIFCVSGYSKYTVGKTVKARAWIHTKGLTLNAIEFYAAELNAAMSPISYTSVAHVNYVTEEWTEIEVEHILTSTSTRYLATGFRLTGAIGEALYFDNVSLNYEKIVDGYLNTEKEDYFYALLENAVPAQWIKFSFVNGSALEPPTDAFIEVGRLLAGKALRFGMYDDVGAVFAEGESVELSLGGTAVPLLNAPDNRTFDLTVKTFRRGEIEEIYRTLEGRQTQQMFLSMFAEGTRQRAMLCSLVGGVATNETPKREFKSMKLSFLREN